MGTTITFKKATAAEWTSSNPVLASGEPGIETDTTKIKIGNGSQAWDLLTYINEAPYNPTFSPTLQRTLSPVGTIASGGSSIEGGFGNVDTSPDLGVHLNGSNLLVTEKEGYVPRQFHVFDVSTGVRQRTIYDGSTTDFGIGASASGQYMVASGRSGTIGVDRSGVLKIYDITTGSLIKTITQLMPAQASNTYMFQRMAMNNNYILGADQSYQVSGVNGAGAVWVYKTTTGDWSDTTYERLLLNPQQSESNTGGAYGVSADVNANGIAAISAQRNDVGPTADPNVQANAGSSIARGGQVFFINLETGSERFFLQSPDPSVGGQFGSDIAFIGTDKIAIGEMVSDTTANNAGRVHIYKTTDGSWTDTTLVASIDSPSGDPVNDTFGRTVVYSDGYLVSNAAQVEGGPVYIFTSASGDWDDATMVFQTINPNDPTYTGSSENGVSVSIDADHMAIGRMTLAAPTNKGFVEIFKLIN